MNGVNLCPKLALGLARLMQPLHPQQAVVNFSYLVCVNQQFCMDQDDSTTFTKAESFRLYIRTRFITTETSGALT